jgi:parallel beta-helix repeat protein
MHAFQGPATLVRSFVALAALLCACSAPAATLYVSLQSTNPVQPYATWDTAATNIQDAVAAAAAGDTVLVTNGVYANGMTSVWGYNRVALTNPVTLTSVNGPQTTVIDGGNQMRGVYIGTNATLSGFTVTNGYYSSPGGGICSVPSGIVSNCVLMGNLSASHGGGISGGQVFNCVLAFNQGRSGGGGASAAALYNCVLSNNTAGYYGGGGADLSLLHNCLVTGNGFYTGGYAGGGTYVCTNYNCTIAGNTNVGTVDSRNINCIIYFNALPEYAYPDSYDAYDHCCTLLLLPGTGNITNDPAFVDSANGDFRLKCGSPCIDAGTDCSSLYTNDIRGAIRPFDGDGTGTPKFDIGAYEYVPSIDWPPRIFSVSGLTNFAANYALSFVAQIAGCASVFWWDFGDGTQVTNRYAVSHAWSSPGQYNVLLAAYYPALGQALIATTQVQVVQQPVYYVDETSPSPTFPYTNWSMAAQDIQSAIGAGATPGRLVLVTNGIYSLSDRWVQAPGFYFMNGLALTNPVIVQSVNGPGVTIAQPAYSFRCAYVGNDAILSGFTLTGGTANDNSGCGGGVFCEPRGVLTNCIVTGNVAGSNGGGIFQGSSYNCVFSQNSAHANGGGTSQGSSFYNCVFSQNQAQANGGGAHLGANFYNCVFDSNQSGSNGGGAYLGTFSDCAFTSNWFGSNAFSQGGGVFGGTLSNCTLLWNSTAIKSYWNPTTGNNCGGAGAAQSTLYNCLLASNSASANGGNGGGALLSTLFNCTISNNTAGAAGGGAFQSILYQCPVSGNTASNGGGVSLSQLYACVLSGNNAVNGGGSCSNTLWNCILTANRASYGGGACGDNLENCTVVNNFATNNYGGCCDAGLFGAIATNWNSIVYYNNVGTAHAQTNYYGAGYCYNCCMFPIPMGAGCITNAPLFVNLAGGDFHLHFGSPCIDAGADPLHPPHYPAPPTQNPLFITNDIAGTPRPLDGNGDGVAAYDIGAYEFNLMATVGTNWLLSYGLDPTDPLVFTRDPANNGFTVLQDWIADINPTNANSAFRISGVSNLPPLTVNFQSSSNRVYTLMSSASLGSGWTPVAGQQAVPGTGAVLSLVDTNSGTAQFYRVGVAVP